MQPTWFILVFASAMLLMCSVLYGVTRPRRISFLPMAVGLLIPGITIGIFLPQKEVLYQEASGLWFMVATGILSHVALHAGYILIVVVLLLLLVYLQQRIRRLEKSLPPVYELGEEDVVEELD